MIRLLSPERETAFAAACGRDPICGARIHTLWRAYGYDTRHLCLWLADGPDGAPSAALALFDGRLIVCADEHADLRELSAFAQTVGGFQTVEAPAGALEALTDALPGTARTFPVLRLDEARRMERDSGICTAPPLREVFALLCRSGELRAEAWEGWLAHTSHLLRHGLGFSCLLYADGGAPAATGGVYAMSEGYGVIGGLFTLPEYRHRGYGLRIVRHLSRLIRESGRIPVLACTENSLIAYYAGAGFVRCGALLHYQTHRRNQ